MSLIPGKVPRKVAWKTTVKSAFPAISYNDELFEKGKLPISIKSLTLFCLGKRSFLIEITICFSVKYCLACAVLKSAECKMKMVRILEKHKPFILVKTKLLFHRNNYISDRLWGHIRKNPCVKTQQRVLQRNTRFFIIIYYY